MRSAKSLIYGRNPVWEALENQVPLDRILMHHTISGERVGDIIRLAKERHVPIMRVPVEKLNAMVRGVHQGVIALGAIVEYTPLQDMISHLYDEGRTPFFFYCLMGLPMYEIQEPSSVQPFVAGLMRLFFRKKIQPLYMRIW